MVPRKPNKNSSTDTWEMYGRDRRAIIELLCYGPHLPGAVTIEVLHNLFCFIL